MKVGINADFTFSRLRLWFALCQVASALKAGAAINIPTTNPIDATRLGEMGLLEVDLTDLDLMVLSESLPDEEMANLSYEIKAPVNTQPQIVSPIWLMLMKDCTW